MFQPEPNVKDKVVKDLPMDVNFFACSFFRAGKFRSERVESLRLFNVLQGIVPALLAVRAFSNGSNVP